MTSSVTAMLRLFAVGLALSGCQKRAAVVPPPVVPAETRTGSPNVDELWLRLDAEVTLANHQDWFDGLDYDPRVVSRVLVKLLKERVGACSQWDTEHCDSHHWGEDLEPGDDAGVEDECAAQRIFLENMYRLTDEDCVSEAESLVALPQVDLKDAPELLDLVVEFVPFDTAIDDYAWLAIHGRGTEADDALLKAIAANIGAQPESVRRKVYRVLAEQRVDPIVAMEAAFKLYEMARVEGDGGFQAWIERKTELEFLPRWTASASLEEVAFRVHMWGAGAASLPAQFVSRKGLTVRRIAHEDWGTMETLDPPVRTETSFPWSPEAEFPAPWDASNHAHPTAAPTTCNEHDKGGPTCAASIYGGWRSVAEVGVLTSVLFERQPKGGFKVLAVETTVWAPQCGL